MLKRLLLAISVFVGLTSPSWAQDGPPLIETPAPFAVIMDHGTGEILFEKNGDTPMSPASMTKMMTAQVVFERILRGDIALTDRFETSEDAWRRGGWASGGSTMGLAIGDTPTVAELLRGMIVLSGNDASIVLAQGVSGSEDAFAAEMNALAAELGLKTARFANATGLYDDNQRISAADLARLAAYQVSDYPDLFDLYALPEYEWRGIKQANRNPLLGVFDGADGLKTGHLDAAGYGLAATAERDGERRILVIHGLDSEITRRDEALRLMGIAFSEFRRRSMAADGVRLAELPVWLGATETVPVVLAEPLTWVAHEDEMDQTEVEILFEGPIPAPVAEGTELGRLVVRIPGRAPLVAPVTAAASVEKLGFWGRAKRGFDLWRSGGDDG